METNTNHLDMSQTHTPEARAKAKKTYRSEIAPMHELMALKKYRAKISKKYDVLEDGYKKKLLVNDALRKTELHTTNARIVEILKGLGLNDLMTTYVPAMPPISSLVVLPIRNITLKQQLINLINDSGGSIRVRGAAKRLGRSYSAIYGVLKMNDKAFYQHLTDHTWTLAPHLVKAESQTA